MAKFLFILAAAQVEIESGITEGDAPFIYNQQAKGQDGK